MKTALKKMMSAKNKIGKSLVFSELSKTKKVQRWPQVLIISTFPPRECGIATYSQDLIFALNNKFKKSFEIKICALQNEEDFHTYPENVSYVLETSKSQSYSDLANEINRNHDITLVLIQHEFGLFASNEKDFFAFLSAVSKPIIVVFHTVLPNPNDFIKYKVHEIEHNVDSIIVMTNSSAKILTDDYGINKNKIEIIPHGTHLVEHANKEVLKTKYNFSNRKIVATFGLLGSGKCIETSINALREIQQKHPEILFLIIGKTHPNILKTEGEKYRSSLEARIEALNLQENVTFINKYLPLDVLLEYLQLTDIYLFTSNDRNQAVSGTFSYAISCGCPIISTPIPHAVEVLQNGNGIIIDFENPSQLSAQVNGLLDHDDVRKNISFNGIHKLAPTAWENAAVAHAMLFKKIGDKQVKLQYKIPVINLNHFKNLTTDFAMIQFSTINQPDINSGYTLDDNARALVAIGKHYQLKNDAKDVTLIVKYYKFIKFCLQPEGHFLNYVDVNKKFTKQNSENLEDANGRAIWALGYLVSMRHLLPLDLEKEVYETFQLALKNAENITSPRAMAFIIKGIYYSEMSVSESSNLQILKNLANKLVKLYQQESKENWNWFESYLTYGNSILPEAMLCAYLVSNLQIYKQVALVSFEFLLDKIFINDEIHVVSNKGWLHAGNETASKQIGGEQPIDVAYTILALSKFYDSFNDERYLNKMKIAFDWFLGKNHLHQIVYNPCTGGCYDGLEDTYINLNQGAESTVSYLMARLTMERYFAKGTSKKTAKLKILEKLNDAKTVIH